MDFNFYSLVLSTNGGEKHFSLLHFTTQNQPNPTSIEIPFYAIPELVTKEDIFYPSNEINIAGIIHTVKTPQLKINGKKLAQWFEELQNAKKFHGLKKQNQYIFGDESGFKRVFLDSEFNPIPIETGFIWAEQYHAPYINPFDYNYK